MTDKARIVLLSGIPLPELNFQDASGDHVSLNAKHGKPRLVNLWASWCAPCLEELKEWKSHSDELSRDLEIVAVNVDSPEDQASTVPELLAKLDLPFKTGLGSESLTQQFDVIQRSLLSRQRPLPVPSSFLIDRDGKLRIVYKGPVSAEVLTSDAKLMDADRSQVLAAAIPFQGRWYQPSGGSTPLQLTVKLIEGGHSDIAKGYVAQLVNSNSPLLSADLVNLLGAIQVDEKEYSQAAQSFLQSLQLDPNNRQAHLEVGELLLRAGEGARAQEHFEFAVKATPNDPKLVQKLGLCQLMQGKLNAAATQMARSLELRPMPMTHWYLADIGIAMKDAGMAITNYDAALRLNPKLIVRSNNLAWLLATTDDEEYRDGERAVIVAEKLIESLPSPKAENLDTLSAAYASADRFADAIETATKAAALAQAEGNARLRGTMQKRLEKYRQKKSLRESL